MNILFVAAEVTPFSSIGGLSQVMHFLPKALQKRGHDVRVFTAKYGFIDGTNGVPRPPKSPTWTLRMEMEGLEVPANPPFLCNVKSARAHRGDPLVYFLENREYYEQRANVYQYADDHIRFALLSKGCLEWLLAQKARIPNTEYRIPNNKSNFPNSEFPARSGYAAGVAGGSIQNSVFDSWFPDIIHANDWHTGYLIDMARHDPRYKDIFRDIPIVYTVHNFRHQGNGAIDLRYAPPEKRDTGESPLPDIRSPKLIASNALVRGIVNADAVNTVSRTHALEVMTPEYGEGIEDILKKHRDKISGILNGLDIREFNPLTDKRLKYRFSVKSLSRRVNNKLALQREMGLSRNAAAPLFGMSGRMDRQKGVDLMMEVLPHILKHDDAQLVVLGGGDEQYRQFFSTIARDHPDRVAVHLRSNFSLPRRIFSGADIILLPSKFEPGGIVAMEAMRYGAVPLVRRTGGLNDIVTDFEPRTHAGNGFSFLEYDPWALYGAMVAAMTTYRNQECWTRLVANCMREDFSWDHAAGEYEELYKQIQSEK